MQMLLLLLGAVVKYDLPMLNNDLPMLNYDLPALNYSAERSVFAPPVVIHDLPLAKKTIEAQTYRS